MKALPAQACSERHGLQGLRLDRPERAPGSVLDVHPDRIRILGGLLVAVVLPRARHAHRVAKLGRGRLCEPVDASSLRARRRAARPPLRPPHLAARVHAARAGRLLFLSSPRYLSHTLAARAVCSAPTARGTPRPRLALWCKPLQSVLLSSLEASRIR